MEQTFRSTKAITASLRNIKSKALATAGLRLQVHLPGSVSMYREDLRRVEQMCNSTAITAATRKNGAFILRETALP